MSAPDAPGVRPAARGADGHVQLWAPRAKRLEILVEGRAPVELLRADDGWHEADLPGLGAGDRYRLRIDGGKELPDPCSRSQPAGVHGPSAVVDLDAFPWTDGGWRGQALADLIIYELHVGTFTAEGTCDAAIGKLDGLVELGVTAIEVMPVSQCPGAANWGYDGVYPFAVQHSIGGATGLQRLVDACHARGIAVVLDVVYNHFGPEGCRLSDFAPVFTDRYRTPWGDAINLDGEDSDGVRDLLLANAWQWFSDFHIDGLRLDAVHEIRDASARPFLAQLAECTQRWSEMLGRRLHLIAESDLNAGRMVRPAGTGGYGLDAQWSDDFHHALHALITGERKGFLGDYGSVAQLRKAYDRSFVFDGCWSPSRRRTHGDSVADLPTDRFVICSQNHDQIGNRLLGERLASLTDAAGVLCAAAAILLSPYVPLLFMGEEYGEKRPFLYFVDHEDPELVEAVRKGRSREFAALHGDSKMPDPASPETRAASCLVEDDETRRSPIRAFYRECIHLRRTLPSLRPGPRRRITVGGPHPSVVSVERAHDACRTLLLLNATGEAAAGVPLPSGGGWRLVLDSEATRWGGGRAQPPGGATVDLPPRSALLFSRIP